MIMWDLKYKLLYISFLVRYPFRLSMLRMSMIIRNKYSYFFWISLQIMATVHCTISMDKRTENLNKHEILSLLVIKCVTLLDYERCLVRYLCHLTFVLRTITYRSSLKLNLDSLKRNCAHSGIRYLVYVFAIFTTFSADIFQKPDYRVFIRPALISHIIV